MIRAKREFGEMLEDHGDRRIEPRVVIHIPDRPFLGQHADDDQLDVADGDHLPDRIGIGKQLLGQGVSQHRIFLLLIHVRLGEVAAVADLHIADGGKSRRGPVQ